MSPPTAAVVTGGGSGLGRAFALELARRGAKVVVADVNDDGMDETVALVEAAGGQAWSHRCDVSDADQVEALWEAAEGAMGHVDTWVNNAGVAVAGDVGESPLEDWRWIMGINLNGVVHGCHVAAPRMKAAGRGTIINVSSAAGLLSPTSMGAYNVTKAGVIALSETLYQECLEHDVAVTVLCPTFFQTNLMDSSRTTDDRQGKLARKLMARSKTSAEDVARCALDDATRGRLYSVPMADGRMFWAVRRLAPAGYFRLTRWLATRMMKRAERG